MPIRNSYLLYAKTLFENNANVIGCFSSYKKAVAYLKTLPEEHVYQICKYQINKSILEQQDIIDFTYYIEHWHFGADFGPRFCVDENDSLFRYESVYEYTITWPDKEERTTYVKMSEFNEFIDNNPVLKKAILNAKAR